MSAGPDEARGYETPCRRAGGERGEFAGLEMGAVYLQWLTVNLPEQL